MLFFPQIIKNKLKIIRIIKGNQKNKFRRKHIVKLTIRKKVCGKSDNILLLGITNLLFE
jgi:hypothetical protein